LTAKSPKSNGRICRAEARGTSARQSVFCARDGFPGQDYQKDIHFFHLFLTAAEQTDNAGHPPFGAAAYKLYGRAFRRIAVLFQSGKCEFR
jgi:hypothetical protein